jgi:hypothetical protein
VLGCRRQLSTVIDSSGWVGGLRAISGSGDAVELVDGADRGAVAIDGEVRLR